MGCLLQLDASIHDWLEGRGPKFALVGAIDDATGHVWARFAPSEDQASYFAVLREIVAAHGIPAVRLIAGFDAPDSNLRLLLTAADTRDKVRPHELDQALRLATTLTWQALTAADRDRLSPWQLMLLAAAGGR